jgi:hypothetical protein
LKLHIITFTLALRQWQWQLLLNCHFFRPNTDTTAAAYKLNCNLGLVMPRSYLASKFRIFQLSLCSSFQVEDEYMIILTLNDGKLSEPVQQSMLLLVEDSNDNRCCFIQLLIKNVLDFM